MIKFIDELKKEDLEGKKVLLRVDFNLSLLPATSDQLPAKIEDFKVKASKETIDYLLDNGASVVMLSHIDPPLDSFASIIDQIAKVLGGKINLISHHDFFSGTYNPARTTPARQSHSGGDIVQSGRLEPITYNLLENIRQDPREVQNNERLGRDLAVNFDLYVNDAFASMHRNHASLAGVAKFLPAYAGLLIRKETENLQKAINAPQEGKILVMGGAKISTKLPVIKNFADKAEKILIGGALANNFFQSQEIDVGASLVDNSVVPNILPRPGLGKNVVLPIDIVVTKDKTGNSGVLASVVRNLEPDELIVDIGPETAKRFSEIIAGSKMVIWNGPMGLNEVDGFAEGTFAIANAVAGVPGSIIGGGDTIAALWPEIREKYGFISTGGGAMLEFLAGNKLPGLEALGYYE